MPGPDPDKYNQKLEASIARVVDYYTTHMAASETAAEGFAKDYREQLDKLLPQAISRDNGEQVVIIPQYRCTRTDSKAFCKRGHETRHLVRNRSDVFHVDRRKTLEASTVKHGKSKHVGRFLSALASKNKKKLLEVVQRFRLWESHINSHKDVQKMARGFRDPLRKYMTPLVRKYVKKGARLPDADKAHRTLGRLFKQVERDMTHVRLVAVLSILDPLALETAVKTRNTRLKDYNWLCDGDPGKAREYRSGAMQAYPGLVGRVADESTTFPADIDKGMSVNLALERALERPHTQNGEAYPARVFRTLHGRRNTTLGNLSLAELRGVLHYLPFLSHAQVPRASREWGVFAEAVKKHEDLRARTGYSRADLAKAFGPRAEGVRDKEREGLSDFIREAVKIVGVPLVARRALELGTNRPDNIAHNCLRPIPQSLTFAACAAFTPRQLLRGNLHWHERVDTYYQRQASAGVHTEAAWLPLTPQKKSPGDVVITPLADKAALKKEGEDLHHCVGGYAWDCFAGSSHIISLRTAKGARSTLQLRHFRTEDKDGKPVMRVEEVQHKSWSNQQPGQDLKDAAAWYIRGINRGEIAVDWDSILSAREAARNAEDGQALQRTLGFDPHDATAREEAYNNLRRHFPGALERKSLEDFIKDSGMDRAVTSHVRRCMEEQDALSCDRRGPRQAAGL